MESYFIAAFLIFIVTYLLLYLYLENQQVRYYEKLKMKHAFYCKQCHKLYSGQSDICPCPVCAKENSYMRF